MNRLRELRISRNLEAEDVSDQLGVATSHLYALERGERRLNEDIIRKAVTFFGVNADYILGLNNHVYRHTVPLLGTIRAGLPILDQEPCGEVEISFSPSL